MAKELVFGHLNPDTDAIVAAIAYSQLQNQLGYETEAVALGEPNDETKFVLDYFDQETPRVIDKIGDQVQAVMLVDHNEAQQSVPDIDTVAVTHVVDHHRIANFKTTSPLFYHAEPVGCTSTILWKMYNENEVQIPQKIAGLMLSAIISDTLLLKSPTTTDDDRQAVQVLADVANVDYQDYGLKMLKAGTNIAAKTAEDLIDADAKTFDMGGHNVRIAQVNVVDLAEALERQSEFEDAMKQSSQTNGYDLFLLAITNVLDSDTTMVVTGDNDLQTKVAKAFNHDIENSRLDLPGVVSRKKQIVPPLQQQF
ncbi:manganese-dependent inorganic pyrophosphatase [Bombilactobacillus bombi]|uniref:inorganic diphosphatase n=1 Tax=Bombilactobacillus bombi TaxID=1303590 RepID=A0A417Z8M5_9LACO|nr:manganese-dependent inorganic pyrophosphatase [Bombilactobacillus bombi]RHW46975.1 manganese-dependent inorganic pyrophosphatase [Bombilactobacillus bombi]